MEPAVVQDGGYTGKDREGRAMSGEIVFACTLASRVEMGRSVLQAEA